MTRQAEAGLKVTEMFETDSIAIAAVEKQSPLRRLTRWALTTPPLWTYAVLLLLGIVFTILSHGEFAGPANLKNILLDGSLLMIVSVGMTLVIITSGIDLSIGAVTIFGSVIAAEAMGAVGGQGMPTILLGLVVGVVAGFAWGIVNGFFVGYAKIAPLIVTLGSLGMATGLSLIVTGGVDAKTVPLPMVLGVGNGSIFGVPYLVIIAAIVTVLGVVYLGHTKRGLYLYAIGSNRDAILRAGVNVRANTLSVYAISGGLAGLAGFLSLARFSTTSLAGHTSDNLQAIAAVVLGGTSLFGGRGGIAGTIAGVLIPAVLSNGFIILGVQPFWQQFAIGLVLILAVYTDRLRRRRVEHETE